MIAQIARSVGKIRPYLSSVPFDSSTADGRARERQRRALLSSMAAMLARVVSVGTQLITVPLTLNYLGAERFGLWMTISSVIAMLAFADLGIGNGLLNAIADANGRNDVVAMRRYISSAAVILSFISCLALLGLVVSYPFVPWAAVFNVHSPVATAEAGPAAAAFIICFALNIPGTIVQRVQLGLQMGFISNIWQVAGSVMALVVVLLLVRLQADLRWLVFAFAGAPALAAVMNGVTFFKMRPDLIPSLSFAKKASALRIMRTGLLFLLLQVVVAVTYASDNLIIARVLGASAVTIYAVPDKMFSIIPMILSIMLTPLWPAYGEAISRGDAKWVKKILKQSLQISFAISTALAATFCLLGPKIITFWIGHTIDVPMLLLLGLGAWKIIEGLGNALAVFLNGANVVGIQIAVATLTALTAVVLKIYLVRTLGVSGAVWATALCFSVFALLPYAILIKKIVATRLVALHVQ